MPFDIVGFIVIDRCQSDKSLLLVLAVSCDLLINVASTSSIFYQVALIDEFLQHASASVVN